jgi:hypothetical protein
MSGEGKNDSRLGQAKPCQQGISGSILFMWWLHTYAVCTSSANAQYDLSLVMRIAYYCINAYVNRCPTLKGLPRRLDVINLVQSGCYTH